MWSPLFLLPGKPVCLKNSCNHPSKQLTNSSTLADLQGSSLQNTGWYLAQNLHKKKDTAVLASHLHCRFSHINVMTLHVCSLTHKPKNTLQAGRHKENQTLDGDFRWEIM